MKQIPNSNYFVDENGNVYGKSKKLKTNRPHNTYCYVCIRFLTGEIKQMLVHRLVAQAYIPNPENKPVVNHKDGNKTNNCVSNLEWVTYKENNEHARKNGYYADEGGTAYSAVYTKEQITRVCELLSENRRNVDIEKLTKVPVSTICSIRKREQWTHVSKDYIFCEKSRRRKVSDDTIHWFCQQIANGFTVSEIMKMTHSSLTRQDVYKIKNKQIYKDISDLYF